MFISFTNYLNLNPAEDTVVPNTGCDPSQSCSSISQNEFITPTMGATGDKIIFFHQGKVAKVTSWKSSFVIDTVFANMGGMIGDSEYF